MDTSDRRHGPFWNRQPDVQADLIAAVSGATPAKLRRLRCDAVARNRAARYARKRRIPKPLWPLLAAIILVGLILERQPLPGRSWTGKRPTEDDESIGCERLGDRLGNEDGDIAGALILGARRR